jgi:pyruvate kinase
MQYDRVIFPDYECPIPFFSERDRKDILRGLSYGIHVIAAAQVKTTADLFELKEFMASQNADKIKIFAKIENNEARANFDEILETADGIILVKEKHNEKDLTEESIIAACKEKGKPIVITFAG